MAKLKLDLDGLAVESFETEPVEGAGTVMANAMDTTDNSSAAVNCICSLHCVPTR